MMSLAAPQLKAQKKKNLLYTSLEYSQFRKCLVLCEELNLEVTFKVNFFYWAYHLFYYRNYVVMRKVKWFFSIGQKLLWS